jgi:BolA protein
MNSDRINIIRTRLEESLTPITMNIIDESHLHAGHQGARESGGGHFNLEIISESFDDKSKIERHRMIYSALGDVIGTDIHALSINARTPSEIVAQCSEPNHQP